MRRGQGIIPNGDPSYSIQKKAMVGDCLEAKGLFRDIMGSPYWHEILDFLDDHGIRGEKLVRFYTDFCGSNKNKFLLTLKMLTVRVHNWSPNDVIYSESELECNWGLSKPVPFCGKNVELDEIEKADFYSIDKRRGSVYYRSHDEFMESLKQAVKEQYYSSIQYRQPNIPIKEMISTTNLVVNVSEGIPECVEAVLGMLDYDEGKKAVLKFEQLGITGDVLRKFYVDGCGEDKQSLLRVMDMIDHNFISYDNILANLSLEHPIPFLDKDIVFNGSWDDLDISKQKKFLRNNAKAFLKKIKNVPKDSFGKMVKRNSPSILDSIINRLSNGDQQVRNILYSFSSNYKFLDSAVFFEDNDIIGENILKIFNCHNEDPDMFYWTIELFLNGYFPVEAIKKNIALTNPLPFINMDIVNQSDRWGSIFDEEYKKRMQDNANNFLSCLSQRVALQQTSYNQTPKGNNMMAPQSQFDLIQDLSAGDEYTASLIATLITKETMPAFKYCYDLGIKGEIFSKFYNYGCGGKINNFYLILEMFKHGIYSKDIIQMNLALPNPVPFIRESSKITSHPRSFDDKTYAYADWKTQFESWKEDFLRDFGGRLSLEVVDSLEAAAPIVLSILNSKKRDGVQDLMFCKTNNIIGNRIVNLYNSCCLENEDLLARTLDHLETDVVPTTIITNNLDLEKPIPFLDDNFIEKYRAARSNSNNFEDHNKIRM